MIYDKIENASVYAGLSENFRKAIQFMLSRDFSGEPAGKYEIDGKEVYATIYDLTDLPAEKERYEYHRSYADIQLVLAGGERMLDTALANCAPMGEYNDQKDIGYCTAGTGVELLFRAGDFAVFFPQDAHMPGCRHPEGGDSKKMVIKVKL